MIALSAKQPYPGLRPFNLGDEEFFFGREAQTCALYAKLRLNRLIAVVGRSGCGKSSLVRAGLLPVLIAESAARGTKKWSIAAFRPQGRPLMELGRTLLKLKTEVGGDRLEVFDAETQDLRRSRMDAMLRRNSLGLVEAARELLSSPDDALLIVVDQFEEIFRFEGTNRDDANEATAFVRLLIEAINADSPQIHVLLTMRLDFLGDCARFQRLPEAISDGQFLVPNLSRAERRAAIEQPALKSGKQIRPEVTQRLLNEIGEDPDQLPVLQHVLMRMWQQAGNDPEITLLHFEETGGVTEAISRHANQIYSSLPSDPHRSAAERLFKAISERDRDGRWIRRARPFAEIAAIVRGDNESMSDAESEKTVIDVIEAFRAADCCFLMPPANEEITPLKRIDISHESLLRGWTKLTGSAGQQGWIVEEADNGRKYNDLLEDEKRSYIFPSEIADERARWWQDARPNAVWSERYGGHFADAMSFLKAVCDRHTKELEIRRKKVVRAKLLRAGTAIVIGVLAASIIGVFYFRALDRAQLEAQREAVAQESIKLKRDYDVKSDQLQKDIEAQRAQWEKIQLEISRTVRNVERMPSTDEQVRKDLNDLVKSSATVSDATAQRAVVDSKSTKPTTLQSNVGFMWIGSAGSTPRSNLNTTVGSPALPNAVKQGDEYVSGIDIYLRQGPPTGSDYVQQATLGILPEGTRVRVLDNPQSFTRPTGDQYWAKVEVIKLALSSVNFQFAGGSRDQAQQISKALQEIGYKIQGEERTGAAAGKREVRYFYNGQRAVAEQLAIDTNKVLQRLGYPLLSGPPVLVGTPPKSNPDGKLELWLEIPPK
jgi:hypothetical protein